MPKPPVLLPNPALHSDPACIAFRSLSSFRFLGFVQRFGAGGGGELQSLGLFSIFLCQAAETIAPQRDTSLCGPPSKAYRHFLITNHRTW